MIRAILRALVAALGLRFGNATTFRAVDRGNPNPHLACVFDRHFKHRILDDRRDVGVALPTRYACLSRVFVYNRRTHRGAVFRVLDRGPAHALVDLTPLAAKAIGSNGNEQVVLFRWPEPPPLAAR